MKRKKKLTVAIGIFFAVAFAVGIAAVAASNLGTESDPLITKSYIDNVLTADLTDKLNKKVDEKAAELKKDLETRIDALEGGGASTYHVVTLQSGDKLTCEVGTELMLRVGSAHCVAGDTPGLIDTTSGGTIDNGTSLTKNHLYMATIAGRAITADEYVMVIVRGGYTIS